MYDVEARGAIETDTDHVNLYTMRQLNQETAATIEEINTSRKPGVITRHGRFVAVIYPLVGEGIESQAIAEALNAVAVRNQLTGESRVDGILTAQEAADDLKLDVDVSRADRELNRGGLY
jgi:hypothetical protein